MKRLGIIAAALALTILFATASCFAGTLEIVDSYPRDGGKGLQPMNCAVKLYFNQDVSTGKESESGGTNFIITDSDKKVQPITVFHDSKDKSMVLVVLNDLLEQDTDYKLTISGDFTAASGDTLGKDKVISFRTRNTGNDGKWSMLMMAVMFVGIVFFSSRQMKRQAQKEAADSGKEKVNPYKVSKETGKSVSSIVEKDEKNKKKKAAAEEKRKAKEFEDEDINKEIIPENDNKRVKAPRPISAAGSTYLSGKKAKAEAEAARKAAARAAGTTRPKNQSGKAKSRKK